MYYGAKNLAESLRTVRKNTLAIAEDIPEDKYAYRVTPDVMSVREMLAHLAVSPMWQIDVHSTKKMDSVDFAFFGARQQQADSFGMVLNARGRIHDDQVDVVSGLNLDQAVSDVVDRY